LGGPLTGDSEGKMGWDVEGSVDGCLYRDPIGELGEGSVYREL
jgi:hypothetical protein